MNLPLDIIDTYYPYGTALRDILLTHSRLVAEKALKAIRRHSLTEVDPQFVHDAALLHDIGICRCDAPGIQCFGTQPYILHGYLGAELLRHEGQLRHLDLEPYARVCERHTGTGLTRQQILDQGLPLPPRDFVPVTLEEQLICWADKFFSKTHPEREKTTEQARHSLEKFGTEGLVKFDEWCARFS